MYIYIYIYVHTYVYIYIYIYIYGLALDPLVPVPDVHVQLHLDALLLHGELVEGLLQPLDALLEPVLVDLVVLDLLQVADVRLLGHLQLFLQGLNISLGLLREVDLRLLQLLRLAARVAELLHC